MRSKLMIWRFCVAMTALLMVAPTGVTVGLQAAVDAGATEATVATSAPGFATDRYIVGFYKDPFLKPGQTYMGEEIVAVDHELLYIIVKTSNFPLFQAKAQLDENVRYLQWDNPTYGHLNFVPNDARYNDAGHWGSKKIGAEAAWDRTLGSTSVKVGMIDSGVYRTHEDLAGSRLLQGYDFTQGDTNPDDESGCSYHGTHTTGTAGATINNGKGIAGMSQHTILPIKGLYYSAPYCTASDSMLANSLRYVRDQGGHISSNSWGGGGVSTVINDAIQYAHNGGVIHIAAAGNSGPCTNCVGEPWKSMASITTIVASTTSSDAQSSFSSEGPQIDVAAPGSSILSAGGGVSSYQSLSGTSMATPHVAGTAALLKALNPSWTFSDVDSRLKNTAVDLGAAGYDQDFGYGRINADAATSGSTPTYQCSDGIDNDGDGLTDYPNDPGCSSTTDNDETNAAGCSGGPSNNCFASASARPAGSSSVTQSTSGATTESGEPAPCASIGGTVWFTWTPTTSGAATVSTSGSNYDTALAVYTGSSLTGLTNVACNDDISSSDLDSRVQFTATAGVTYRIQGGGYNGATGSSFVLGITAPATSCSGTPSNNAFSCSVTISSRPYTNTQSSSGATLESGEPRPCASIGSTVWYSWTPTSSGTWTVDTRGSNFDTALAIYTGSSVTGLTNLNCNDDISSSDLDSSITRSFTAGTTYRIQVGGYNGATGSTLKLNIN